MLAEATAIGGRDINQDSHAQLQTEAGTLLVVADGLGGHEGGELASRYFCQGLVAEVKRSLDSFAENPAQCFGDVIARAVERMREAIRHETAGVDAHTTCAIAWVGRDRQVTTAHIGDSRIYLFNRDKVTWRSRDHSVVQMLVDMGEVDEKDMARHPEQGSLTRSISMQGAVRPTVKLHGALAEGCGVLLCSDGFWEEIAEKEITSLARGSVETKLNKLVKAAVNRAGEHGDNVTAVVFIV